MHFRYISAKIQFKSLKQHFDWEGVRALWASPLATPLSQTAIKSKLA